MIRTCTLLYSGLLLATAAQAQSLAATASPAAEAADKPANQSGTELPAAPRIYTMADEMPAFVGGPPAFLKFLHDKTRYPDEALQRNISGKVHVSFVVDEQGRILDPKVVRGLGYGLDEEALRLVRIMPWWTPSRIAGQPVRVSYTLPINFRAL